MIQYFFARVSFGNNYDGLIENENFISWQIYGNKDGETKA